jgi:hypothetical protein
MARRSGRKRKEREELLNLSAELVACLCSSSAAPLDDSEHPNVGRCRNEGCETKWVRSRALSAYNLTNGCSSIISGV